MHNPIIGEMAKLLLEEVETRVVRIRLRLLLNIWSALTMLYELDSNCLMGK